MSEKPVHPIDALHDAISGRLRGAARAELDGHLAACDACRHEFELLSALRRGMAAPADAAVPVPADLEAGLRQALDAEDRARGSAPGTGPAWTGRRWIGWGAAAAAAAVLAVVLVQRGSFAPNAAEEVAQDLRRYAAGTLAVDTRTADPVVLERRLASAGLGFPARVFDFGMMAYQLGGGGVHRVQGRASALFVYDGPDALKLLCQMYLGSVDDLPAPTERRTNNGIDFLVYREGEVTVVFWQEADGRVVCALAGNGDPETAVQFAFAKAVGGGAS